MSRAAMDQPTLFDERPPDVCRNYHGGDENSEAANESINESKSQMRERVAAHVEQCGKDGATCDEIEVALSMRHQTVSARCRELLNLGRIVRSGLRRPTRSGRNAWVLHAAGVL